MNEVLKIGVVGFSSNQFDRQAAVRILEAEFEKLAKKHLGHRSIEIVSGYTAMGVPKIAYELAEKFGFTKVGFSARQAFKVKSGLYKVDKKIIIGEKFGDESVDFIEYIDGLIRVGGGQQSRNEVELFKEANKELPIDKILKEYEIAWLGIKPKITSPPSNVPLMEKNTKEKIILKLDEDHEITIYRGIEEFQLSAPDFKHLWESHPSEFHEVLMHGKLVKTPRWQQAYGKSYEYTGSKNNALPITEEHLKYLAWCKKEVDDRINGLLINWYSGELQHYIGKHRDSTKGLMSGSPIVTISHGGERVFRFRPFRGEGFMDITVEDGDVVIVPWKTNKSFTHEVPYHKKFTKDRISITLRAYE